MRSYRRPCCPCTGVSRSWPLLASVGRLRDRKAPDITTGPPLEMPGAFYRRDRDERTSGTATKTPLAYRPDHCLVLLTAAEHSLCYLSDYRTDLTDADYVGLGNLCDLESGQVELSCRRDGLSTPQSDGPGDRQGTVATTGLSCPGRRCWGSSLLRASELLRVATVIPRPHLQRLRLRHGRPDSGGSRRGA